MKNLTKAQWSMLIIAVVSMIFTTLLSGVLQIGATGIAIIGILKFAWDLYLSFTDQDVANFANNENVKSGGIERASVHFHNKADVKAWASKKK